MLRPLKPRALRGHVEQIPNERPALGAGREREAPRRGGAALDGQEPLLGEEEGEGDEEEVEEVQAHDAGGRGWGTRRAAKAEAFSRDCVLRTRPPLASDRLFASASVFNGRLISPRADFFVLLCSSPFFTSGE